MLLLGIIWACTCAETTSDDDWLLEKIYQDNLYYLAISPKQLAFKFQAMNDSSYDFMRGSLSLYLGHRERLSQQRTVTSFLNTPEARLLPVIGDPHPENITICAEPSQSPSIEFVDLDSSDYGPWLLDVQRAAMALRIFGGQLDGCFQACQDESVVGFITGYQLSLQGDKVDFKEAAIFVDLLEEALEEGESRKKYNKYVAAGHIKTSENLDEWGKGILSIPSKDSLPDKVFTAFSQHRDGEERLLDVGRRYGMGVSSRPAFRYVFLWDEGGDSIDDDRLMMAREVFDPPVYPGRINYPNGIFDSNGHRVKALTKQLWSNEHSDVNYTGIQVVGMSFKTVTMSSYLQDIKLEKIQEGWDDGDITEVDLIAMSRVIGGALGKVHTEAENLEGAPANDIILNDIQLGGGGEVFRTEILRTSRQEQRQLYQDHVWFQQKIIESGALLGMFRL